MGLDNKFMKIKKLVQTLIACPSQWEGTLEDGRMIYCRYRWGHLSISVSEEATEDVYDAVNGQNVYHEKLGDEYDGVLDDTELIRALNKLNFYIGDGGWQNKYPLSNYEGETKKDLIEFINELLRQQREELLANK